MVKIAPSILSADLCRLGEELAAMEAAGADYHHFDVMDGHFVPNLTYGPVVMAAAKRAAKIPLDVHLMIADPLTYGPIFAEAGAGLVTFHPEATPHAHKGLAAIRAAGALAGLALNPATPVEALSSAVSYLDLVLVMGVNPGFGGQAYIPETTAKVAELRRYLDRRSPERRVLIEIDGGVTDRNAKALAEAGADILVSGSYLYRAANYAEAIASLK